jgi:murein DD-endopeptidase MepM/ murein hydrolase activator NlpD
MILISAVPLSVAFKSYVWERHRTLIGEDNILYDLFLIDEFKILGEEQYPDAIRNGFTVPTLTEKSYVVKKGDSLYSIAKKHKISVDTILSMNNMKDASILRIGTVLDLPNMSGINYTVRRGDSLSSITARYKVDMNKLVDVNELDSSVIQVGQKLFIPGASLTEWERAEALGTLFKFPVNGRLTSRMGFRTDPFTLRRAYHAGIDLANRIGTPVTASQSGKVIFSGYKGNYGKTVIISHQQGYSTVYGHLDKILVRKGQSVRQGQQIATVGNTGRSTGPHLHFEIRRYRRNIDPLKLLHR